MFKRIKRTSLVLGIALTVILGMSYGTFIFTTNSYRSTEMLVSNLTYGIEITSTGGSETINGTSVSLTSGKTSTVLLKITSLNKIISKYGVDYKMSSGTGSVKYASNTGWLPTGKINENNVGTYEKVIKVVISATTDVTVDFTVTGGYSTNDLTEVKDGYTRLTEIYDGIVDYKEDLKTIISKETTNNIYGGEAINNYLQYPTNTDATKNIWRVLGYYNSVDGIKVVSNQASTTTESNISSSLTSFYNTLEKQEDYVLETNKFNCTNTTCTTSNYSNIGLLSTSEYNMLGGVNSYLASSESYFGLDNTTIKNITSSGITDTTTSTTSGLRGALYLQSDVKVTGSGTATFTVTPNDGYKSELESHTCGGTLSGNTYTISNITSGKSCSITFKSTPTLYAKLLADKTTRPGARTDFSTVLTNDNTKTLYTSTENGTTVYYFAGNATDNWVKFGKNASNQDLYWRIIRTNSDGSVRLLYHGTSTTATDAYIGISAFNSSYDNIAYVSYMYGSLGSVENARANTNNSTIKGVIDTWYKNNLNTNYGKYISTTAVYCNDRSNPAGGYNTGNTSFYYGAYTRLIANKTPSYDCATAEDKFTADSSTGNGKLKYPIALMTADEVSFAGGLWVTNAPTWYYYNSANGSSTGTNWWWSLSPYNLNGSGYAAVFGVNGSSYPGRLNGSDVNLTNGVRPAISLKSCVKTSGGDGSASAPYTIEESTSGC